jgi:SAM-dependent methyltransferase
VSSDSSTTYEFVGPKARAKSRALAITQIADGLVSLAICYSDLVAHDSDIAIRVAISEVQIRLTEPQPGNSPNDFSEHLSSASLIGGEWLELHKAYWDRLAPSYDGHYGDMWSAAENMLVKQRIGSLLAKATVNPKILEFGCGTGLGYLLIQDVIGPIPSYVGVDISPGMLATFRQRIGHPVHLINRPLEAFCEDSFHGLDAVIAIFTSGSYINLDLRSLLALLCGWLKPDGGVMYVSFLNRSAVRYIPRWGWKRNIQYSTRGSRHGSVPARRYTKVELLRACAHLPVCAIVRSLGPLTGLVQAPALWQLNMAMEKFTFLTHTIDLLAKRTA